MQSFPNLCWAILLLAMSVLDAAARTEIGGIVSDIDGMPVSQAIVRAEIGRTTVAFANTNADGTFELSFDCEADSLSITVGKLAYEPWAMRVANDCQRFSIMLVPATMQLREVVVSAPAVYQKGDTLRFDLARFIGKGDVSLEDALGKIPGITVGAGGKIKYMGRDISNFYIEGLEMLGGNYALATRGLPAEHVAGVEVLNNHNEAKMDQGRLSEEVALNVRLKREAMLRPVGTSEASAGAGQHRLLYALGATGLLFTQKFQATIAAKIGNIDEFANAYTSGAPMLGNSQRSLATEAVGRLSIGSPPIAEDRYMSIDDRVASVNAIARTTADATLRVNASYGFHSQSNSSSDLSSYFLGDGQWLTLSSQSTVRSWQHKPMLDARYVVNSDKRYIQNNLSLYGAFNEISLPILADGNGVSQREKCESYGFSAGLDLRFRSGRSEWLSSSQLAYARTPSLALAVASDVADWNARQLACSTSLRANQRLRTSRNFGPSRWDLSLSVDYEHSLVETFLEKAGAEIANDMIANAFTLVAAPRYVYTSRRSRLELQAGLEVKWVGMRGRNRVAEGTSINFSKPYADPVVSLAYKTTAASKWSARARFDHGHGDVLTLLTNPVLRDYRSLSVRSGLLGRDATFSASASYDFKDPVALWFAWAKAEWSTAKQNLLSGQYITESASSSMVVASENRSSGFNISASASKGVETIRAKFTLSGGCSWSKGRILQQGCPTTYYSTLFHAKAQAIMRPWGWLETTLGGEWSRNGTRFSGVASDYANFTGNFILSFFPIDVLEVKAKADYYDRQLGGGMRKRMALIDASATYKIKSLRMRLSLNNMLNHRHYSYIACTGLDTYAQDYTLRGREIVISLIFTK